MSVVTALPPVGTEALDERDLDCTVAEITLREIATTNVLFGGHRALRYGLRELCREIGALHYRRALDVGAGDGQATAQVRRVLGNGVALVALDHHRSAAKLCRTRGVVSVVGDMWAMPLEPDSVDVVIASLVLHHVSRSHAARLIGQWHSVARLGVVITDLRRSSVASAGFELASRVLRFHPVTRHDGHVSIRRGFREHELARVISAAGVRGATVRRRPGWRLVAYWKKADANA